MIETTNTLFTELTMQEAVSVNGGCGGKGRRSHAKASFAPPTGTNGVFAPPSGVAGVFAPPTGGIAGVFAPPSDGDGFAPGMTGVFAPEK